MQQLDDRILEHLDEEGWLSPRVMVSQSEIDEASKSRIHERCEFLVYAGFAAPLTDTMYEITRWGQLYLEGEVDAEHCPRPTVERALR
jgi:hypothetical protein